jgi:glutathione synthase/RimK-type ligase-like ATP-grasp enzyme
VLIWQLINQASAGQPSEAAMAESTRIFVDAVKRYCARHEIAVETRSQGWLIVMQRGSRRYFALGYDVGLNSAIAHRIANDKGATAEVLEIAGIACVPHTVFLNPALDEHIPQPGSWQAMLELLEKHPEGIVIKPNEGTSGKSVFLVSTRPKLERAAAEIFSSHLTLAISPYVEIEEEVRVVVIDELALVVYRKQRGPNWRHNLDAGARPVLLEQGNAREACVAIAVRAAKAIGIRFASVDVVSVGGSWLILEINSGVMMEALGKLHPELVDAAYSAALDRVFE